MPVSSDDAAVSPLSPEQQLQFAEASRAVKKLAGAARMAAFNGGTMLVLAVLCLPFALMDLTNLVAAAVLATLGSVELFGRNRLQRLNPAAGRLLALNQLLLLVAILLYCGWSIYTTLTGPDPLAGHLELQSLEIDIAGLERALTWALYGGVAAGSVIYQGLSALYYFSTSRRLRAYIQQTPDWVVQLQRET